MARGPKPKTAAGKDFEALKILKGKAQVVLEAAETSIALHGSYYQEEEVDEQGKVTRRGLLKRNPAVTDRLAALSLLTRIASAMGGEEHDFDEYERYLQEKQGELFKGVQ